MQGGGGQGAGGSADEYDGLYTVDLDFEQTVHPGSAPVTATVDTTATGLEAPDIYYLTAFLRFDGEFPDSRAEWHPNYTPMDRWVRAHVLREARGMSIQALADYLNDTPSTANAMGFFEPLR